MMEAEEAQRSILEEDPDLPSGSGGDISNTDHWEPELGEGAQSLVNDGDEFEDEEDDPEVIEQEFHDELFEFIPQTNPQPSPDLNQPGPSRLVNTSTTQPTTRQLDLDDDDDTRVTEQFAGAARVIRMDSNLHQRWKEHFGGESSEELDDAMEGSSSTPSPSMAFAPFASELDWRVAHWAVTDGIGHKSFDRLLSIPGVSSIFCLTWISLALTNIPS